MIYLNMCENKEAIKEINKTMPDNMFKILEEKLGWHLCIICNKYYLYYLNNINNINNIVYNIV